MLITHEHADHVDHDKLAAAAADNPDLHFWAPSSVTDQLATSATLKDRLSTVGPGQTFDAGGLACGPSVASMH